MKTAVITGASYGIGQAITKALLEHGYKVYGLCRSEPKLDRARFVWLSCDLSRPDQIKESLEDINESVIDVLVSNAGVITVELASAVSQASYEKTFSVNVLAPMLIVHELRSKIKSATIISVSSVSDRIPEADVALYCSSKAANTLYFNALAEELKDAKVYTLLPDYVDTPMLHSTMDSDKSFNWGATIHPADIAKFCSRLISGKMALESGANIIVVSEALKEDLKRVEKLYGFITDTKELIKL